MKNFNKSYIGVRIDLITYIEPGDNIVLDVGCAIGANGKYLIENNLSSTVYGVEYDSKMAKKAEENISKVFQGDLNNENFRKTLIEETPQFDYILFGDILEHLIEPEIVLKEIVKKLKPSGKVILSLPNIAHLELFVQVYLKGTWPRNPRGIFDNTHLRWFTKKDAIQMIENSGLNLLKYERNLRARDAIGSKFDWKYNFLKWLNRDWVTFQHILICNYD